MIIIQEELWKNPGFPGLIVITGNGTIGRNGKLIMGRGAAKQAKDRIKGIDRECGAIARAYVPLATSTGYSQYGFMIVREPTDEKIGFGVFQVKWHYAENACLDMIERSAKLLNKYALENPDTNIRMNFPGIGAGKLKFEEVEPIVVKELTAHNLTICTKGK